MHSKLNKKINMVVLMLMLETYNMESQVEENTK